MILDVPQPAAPARGLRGNGGRGLPRQGQRSLCAGGLALRPQ